MKYLNTEIGFIEFPNEISLLINITNCPFHCEGCHSPELWENIGIELTKQVKAMAEEGRVSVRNIRHEAIEDIESLELPEDVEKAKTNEIQDLVNEYNKKIDELCSDDAK